MEKAIYFDMDGTIADLYGVENWLDMLQHEHTAPYENARCMVNMSRLARLLNALQRKGYRIGILSWGAKNSSMKYQAMVKSAKLQWLYEHLHSVHFNEIHIVPYGIPKHVIAEMKSGILFDDDIKNRKEWAGIAFDEKNILEILKNLAKNA